MGLEEHITKDMNISFVGEYNPTIFFMNGGRMGVKPSDIKGWDTPIWDKSKELRKNFTRENINKKKKK